MEGSGGRAASTLTRSPPPSHTSGVMRVQDEEGTVAGALVEVHTQQRVGQHPASDHDGGTLQCEKSMEVREGGRIGQHPAAYHEGLNRDRNTLHVHKSEPDNPHTAPSHTLDCAASFAPVCGSGLPARGHETGCRSP